jgi:uncharacterized 2Fe-2S/4Fe-4S cluster protein (DUF4445 family)
MTETSYLMIYWDKCHNRDIGMTEKGINLHPSDRKTKRCHICTACGRCGCEASDITIIKSVTPSLLHIRKDILNELPKSNLAAIDVGTTTIAMVLYNAEGEELDSYTCVNPQRVYGADVLSRVLAGSDPETASELRRLMQQALEEGLTRFCDRMREVISFSRETLFFSLAANTTMIYLLLGWDTAELGRAPFYPGKMLEAAYPEDFSLELAGMRGVILPGFSAFLGGDSSADLLALHMWEREHLTLLLDLGTNCEILLGNQHKILAASTAAGSAFEGGTSDIWGTDIIALTARLLEEGIVDHTGLLSEKWFDTGIKIGDVRITQEVIRSLQLAKGAIAAGVSLLLDKYGVQDLSEISQVILAGGFGFYLQNKDATRIGLLPSTLIAKAIPGGNIALAGAYLYGRILQAGTDTQIFRQMLSLGEKVEIVNLAEEQEFMDRFVASIDFPLSEEADSKIGFWEGKQSE